MSIRAGVHGGLMGWWKRTTAILADRRGVAAVEFAVIAPLLLSMYFVTMEVSQGIEANKKVSRMASLVADLVTQQPQINTTELDAIMDIGESLLQPYNRSRPDIYITAIEITDEDTPKTLVFWSRKLVNGVASRDQVKGDATMVPDTLRTRGSFLVRVETRLNYQPMISWAASSDKSALGLTAAFDSLDMSETYYLRPRMSSQIPCTGC